MYLRLRLIYCVQWSLWKKDTLGATSLSFIERLSFARRLNNTTAIRLVPSYVSIIGRLSSARRVLCQRFHCIGYSTCTSLRLCNCGYIIILLLASFWHYVGMHSWCHDAYIRMRLLMWYLFSVIMSFTYHVVTDVLHAWPHKFITVSFMYKI